MLSRTLAMMNQQTRCLSKMPEAVRAEISPTRLNNNSDKLIDLRAFPCAKLCQLTKPSNARGYTKVSVGLPLLFMTSVTKI